MRTEINMVKGIEQQQDKDNVTKALHNVWGVREVDVHLSNGEVAVSYDENATSPIDITQAILDAGYQVVKTNNILNEDNVN
ncbi:heavy-metal-associated domain-containing protein [Priestia megaterium]|uniref:heavy-metal-associated domain-containing protein n=1 Tax=Priestia megaterium TaxID=1404 RepID=UPI0027302B43|nr:heavy-metal-associated domain-containing protein [Priestia megaterium]MDP1442251.1 heavy-metal-associated domain-containing protein [Priestia megaterium]MDP1471159.1 heavy-metal-associated domain-containing protein [Priestia megaterium]